MRKVYPGYFSKMVMAHEMGHYFGLCHINHNGVQNIMFSTAAGNSVLDWGLFGYYLNAEPHFQQRQEECVALHRRPVGQRALARVTSRSEALKFGKLKRRLR